MPIRALTLPSATSRPSFLQGLSLHDTPQAVVPRSRSSSLSSSGSASTSSLPSSPSRAPQSPNAGPSTTSGVSRKVAESLQLFKETTNTPTEEIPHLSLGRHTTSAITKRKASKISLLGDEEAEADIGEAEPEFEFVKRSQWPDRESAAMRREKSSVAIERVRTRESVSNTAGVRDRDREADQDRVEGAYENAGERRGSTKENGVSMSPMRGRPSKRRSWKDVPSTEEDNEMPMRPVLPDSSGSSSSVRTFQEGRRSGESRSYMQSDRHVHTLSSSPSPPLSPSKRTLAPPISPTSLRTPPASSSNVDNDSPPFRTPPPISIPLGPAEPDSLCSTPIQSAAPRSIPRPRRRSTVPALDAAPPTPAPAPTPFYTDDELFEADDPDFDFDFDSEWDTASVTTSASTRTSPPLASPVYPLSHLPLVNGASHQQPAVASGLDDEYAGFGRTGLRSPERARAFSPGTRTTRSSAPLGVPASDNEDGSGARKRQQHFFQSESDVDAHDAEDLGLNDNLPHIPLRPFRNQVGGHSAIYKFTKRAVCKVSDRSFSRFVAVVISVYFRYLCLRSSCQIRSLVYLIFCNSSLNL